MGEENLTIRAEAKGTEETAKKLDAVAAADKRLQTQVGEVAATTDKATEAQKRHTASTEDWTAILSRVHPALGGLADAMVKGSRIAGDLATQNIKLGGTLKSVTSAVKNNAASLALIGAGGAVVAGIMAIAAAWRQVKKDTEEATAAEKRYHDARNEGRREERAQQQGIEGVSDVRRRGGLSAGDAARATEAARAVGRRYPTLDEGALTYAAGMMGDVGLSQEELARAAFLQSIGELRLDPRMSARQMRGRFEGQAGRLQPSIDTFFGRETGQAARSVDTAVRGGPDTAIDIEEFIKNLPGEVATGHDPKRLAAIVDLLRQGVGAEPGPMSLAQEWEMYWGIGALNYIRATHMSRQARVAQELAEQGLPTGGGNLEARALEARVGEFVAQQLARERERRGGGSGTVINNYNPKFIGPSADVQRRARRNGEAAAAAAERFR